MKKLLIFLSVFLWSYTITNTKTYSKKLEPDMLKANLQVTITQKNLDNLIEILNQNVKTLKTMCQKTTYSFQPVYKYINKSEIFDTYKANIYATCSFKNKEIKNFSKLINSLKNSKVRLTSLNYTTNENEKQTVIKSLKTKAYNDILKEAAFFSKKLNKKCFATNINIYTPYAAPKRVYMTKSLSSLPLPKDNKQFTIRADYKIECY
ncbi:SIMPL domain-containing protein [Nautilia lithotrophica]